MGLNEFLEQEETSLVKAEEGQLIVAKQMQDKLIELENTKKEIETKEKEMKKQLEEVMRANGITGYESNDKRIKISLGEDGITESIDKDKLFKEYPDAYRECLKETPRKGTLRITIREEE
jgi:hypothetical protein